MFSKVSTKSERAIAPFHLSAQKTSTQMKKKGKSKVKNKELESSITNKFMEAIHGLGHDAEKLKKEITKAGKSVSQKISSVLKDAEKALTKTDAKKDKPEKKAGKKKDAAKKETKITKAVSEISKAALNKSSTISSRSVAKPTVPPIDKLPAVSPEKEEVKEAPAATPVKRTRAPRRKKEEIEAQKAAEKSIVKEASAPVKRKRAPRKPTPKPQSDMENTTTEAIGSAVL